MNKQEKKYLQEFVRNLKKEQLTELKSIIEKKEMWRISGEGMECPQCRETKELKTERRPDGDTTCMICWYKNKTTDWEEE